MDEEHAAVILRAVLSEYERRPHAALVSRMGQAEEREVRPPNGACFKVRVVVSWAHSVGGPVRVKGVITDGRAATGPPVTADFCRKPDGGLTYDE